METIKVKYFCKDLPKLEKLEKGDWIDLRAAENVSLNAGEYKLIPLGIGVSLPKGYEAIMAPRSSTFKNFHILMTNSIGVIDNSYSGDNDQWHFPALAIQPTNIKKGDRICQFRIQKNQPELAFEEVETLAPSNRGGFGTSGIN